MSQRIDTVWLSWEAPRQMLIKMENGLVQHVDLRGDNPVISDHTGHIGAEWVKLEFPQSVVIPDQRPKPVKLCRHWAKREFGTGPCNTQLSPDGSCPRAGQHLADGEKVR